MKHGFFNVGQILIKIRSAQERGLKQSDAAYAARCNSIRSAQERGLKQAGSTARSAHDQDSLRSGAWIETTIRLIV